MKFEWRNIASSEGWSLAHSITAAGKKWPKDTILTEKDIKTLSGLDIDNVQVFMLEPDDINENDAAKAAADHICGKGLKVVSVGRGRANLVATADGLFIPDKAIDAINLIDDAFSAASLPAHTHVQANQLVATVKLVPYAIPKKLLSGLAANDAPTAQVHAYNKLKAATIITGSNLPNKIRRTLEHRLDRLNGNIENYEIVAHTQLAVTKAISELAHLDIDLILILGVSAISDHRDVIPAGLEAANGEIIKLGMPTDPGNLLMLGKLQGKYVIGLPGCARSPALNGLDFVLERIAAGIPLDHQSITLMGTGGLLKETPERHIPRSPVNKASDSTSIAPIVLAAGKASRAQGISKLLSKINDRSVLETTITNIAKNTKSTINVVTGHNAPALNDILGRLNVTIVHNAEYADGMGASLAVGVTNLTNEPTFAMICLADMPFIRPDTYEKLNLAAQCSHEGAILIPTFNGKRGHPVLWHQQHFKELSALNADIGGKQIMQDNQEYIVEVPVEDAGILIDLDTPEMLKQFGVTPVDQ